MKRLLHKKTELGDGRKNITITGDDYRKLFKKDHNQILTFLFRKGVPVKVEDGIADFLIEKYDMVYEYKEDKPKPKKKPKPKPKPKPEPKKKFKIDPSDKLLDCTIQELRTIAKDVGVKAGGTKRELVSKIRNAEK